MLVGFMMYIYYAFTFTILNVHLVDLAAPSLLQLLIQHVNSHYLKQTSKKVREELGGKNRGVGNCLHMSLVVNQVDFYTRVREGQNPSEARH